MLKQIKGKKMDCLIKSYYTQYAASPYYTDNIDGKITVKDFVGVNDLLLNSVDYSVNKIGESVAVEYYHKDIDMISTHILEMKLLELKLTNLEYELLLYIKSKYKYIYRYLNKLYVTNDTNYKEVIFNDLFQFIQSDEMYEVNYILEHSQSISDL